MADKAKGGEPGGSHRVLALEPTKDGETRLVPLRDVKPAPWNPRTITQKDFDDLCTSLANTPRFLWDRPVLVQASTGQAYGGNMRYRGGVRLAQERRWPLEYYLGTQPAIPCRVNDVDDVTAQADSFKDNNTWGKYQEDEAGALLADLRERAVDVTVLGFDQRRLDELLSAVGTGQGVNHIGDAADLDAAQLDDEGEGRGLTPDDKLLAFEANSIRQVVLHFALPEYVQVIALFDALRSHLGVESNADVVAYLLKEAAPALVTDVDQKLAELEMAVDGA